VLSTSSYLDEDYLYTCSYYARNLSATDADGETVTFELLNKPPGMTLSGNQFRWIPSASQVGESYITLRAKDGSGGMDQRVVKLPVQDFPELCSCPHYPYCIPAAAQPVDGPARPTAFELSQNQPNPLSAGTMIRFAIPTATHVKLEIFDL